MTAFDLNTFWNAQAQEHLDVATASFETLQGDFARLVDVCSASVSAGGKILFFGNGGSAADAQHLATELSVRYVTDRAPIAALALTTDTSTLTAAANDMGFEQVFARQIDALGKPGDVAIGISTSGQSKNVLLGLMKAQEKNLMTVCFTGAKGQNMADLCDVSLMIPSTVTARIQEIHITIGQMLCGALEQKLGLV
jgi:D-sedoheptulose 7-phosphate isomerase